MKHVLEISAKGEMIGHCEQDFPLHRLQQFVGGYIEIVHPVGLIAPYVMVVDEEGLLKNKPINRIACQLYNSPSPIIGDVIIMAEGLNEDGENDIIGMDDRQAAAIWRYIDEIRRRIGIAHKEKSPETAATVPEPCASGN